LRFNDDGTFERQITKPDGICATLRNDAGSWSVYEEGSKTWIRVVGGEDMLVKAYIGNYLRLEGDFAGWGNSVNLYRCNETLYPAN
jgi:hypothetical protein